jgi:hypothetical protein
LTRKRAVTTNGGSKRQSPRKPPPDDAPKPKKPDMTNRQRQTLLRARRAEDGLVQCNLWVPEGAIPELRRAAELIRENPALAVARLVDTRTGKLRGLK